MVQALAIDSNSAPSTPKRETAEEEPQIPGKWSHSYYRRVLSDGILASPQQSPLPTSKDTLGQESPTDFVVLKDADLANDKSAANEPTQEDEPSAADYDPTMDMQEDKIRHDHHQRKDEMSSGAYDETAIVKQDVLLPEASVNESIQKKAEGGFDMFAENDDFDMFADGFAVTEEPEQDFAKAVPVSQAKTIEMGMLDDWDDPEGYYKVILGEFLDKRYQVQSNLGKGMFSGVVRALDQETKRLVAIKLIRNNETM